MKKYQDKEIRLRAFIKNTITSIVIGTLFAAAFHDPDVLWNLAAFLCGSYIAWILLVAYDPMLAPLKEGGFVDDEMDKRTFRPVPRRTGKE